MNYFPISGALGLGTTSFVNLDQSKSAKLLLHIFVSVIVECVSVSTYAVSASSVINNVS